jgi:hypothetical protein
MVEAEETSQETGQTPLMWWVALGYAGIVAFAWLYLAMSRLFQWRAYTAAAETIATQGNIERAAQIQAFAGSIAVDMGYAFATAAIIGFVAFALARRTWNAWDYATLVIGFVTVLSLIFLCARGRVMAFIPLSTAPLLALLYTPGVKAACGVGRGRSSAAHAPSQSEVSILSITEIEQEIAEEHKLIMQLSQNLDVFEVERDMDTDTFVARYANGQEEETADNAEWFNIARTVRRSRERVAELSTQLSIMSNGQRRE